MYPGRMTVMDRTVVDLLDQQAREVADANPPGKIALTAIAFLFTALGFIVGRSVWYFVHATSFMGLALRYGYRAGAKVPVQPRPAPA